ncbi:MAG: 30S ribosomal protein S2 [Parcubacteria group bacterium]|nr:30S ribosomal protein S2 [Parcubacteria group bacterium]
MVNVEDLLKAGAHIGHKKSKWNPKMAPFVFGVRNNLHIIDVTKTLDKLNQAVDFLRELVRSGGIILWVGARIQSRDLIKEAAEELGMPYVTGRWIGGLFTNFKIIKERLKYFLDLEKKFAQGEMSKYTKKEQLDFERQLAKLARDMGGVRNLQTLPQAIFVTDVKAERDAVREAKKMGIKVVAVVDTGSDPTLADYVIPANNDSVDVLRLLVGAIKEELKNVMIT